MKINELMIGDWVNDSENERSFHADKCLFEYCDDWDRIHPIPLTKEILKANGFRESIEEDAYYFPERYEDLNKRGFALETEGDGRWMITDHQLMVFRYVHELQHTLRLCGLNELADNFKVI